jgi:hypothetical protein
MRRRWCFSSRWCHSNAAIDANETHLCGTTLTQALIHQQFGRKTMITCLYYLKPLCLRRQCVWRQVDKIFGPGNQYVTAAKMLLTNSEAMISIDMPAGPSEVLVIAGGAGESMAALAMVTAAAAAAATAAAACQCALCCYRARRAQ